MSDNKIEEGDKASWSWNGSNPSGTVAEVKEGQVSVTSHRGNEISKTGDASDPAVHISRPGNDVVKNASELNVESKGSSNGEAEKAEEKKSEPDDKSTTTEDKNKPAEANSSTDAEKQSTPNGEAKESSEEKEDGSNAEEKDENDEVKAGDKRKANEKADVEKEGEAEKSEEKDAKKQKTTNGDSTANGAATAEKKKPGRPKGTGANGDKSAAKKEKKIPAAGKSQRKTRSQGTA